MTELPIVDLVDYIRVETIIRDRTFEVLANWDPEACVWVAESDDIPGLVAEAESPGSLARKLRILIPELLELNGVAPLAAPRVFHVRYQHEECVALVS